MAEKKMMLARALERAFRLKSKVEIKSLVRQIRENGWNFIAVAYDGFVAENEDWVLKAIEVRDFFLANVFVDVEAKLA